MSEAIFLDRRRVVHAPTLCITFGWKTEGARSCDRTPSSLLAVSPIFRGYGLVVVITMFPGDTSASPFPFTPIANIVCKAVPNAVPGVQEKV